MSNTHKTRIDTDTGKRLAAMFHGAEMVLWGDKSYYDPRAADRVVVWGGGSYVYVYDATTLEEITAASWSYTCWPSLAQVRMDADQFFAARDHAAQECLFGSL